ncbi:MAG: helix-turn-helix transcriptional regulator, partial [Firmicutes bacterium]|nr:helix-turn-helix transcriptional regulator [Bacillota bacterium]
MLTEFGKMCRKMRIDRNELLAEMAGRVGVSPAFLSAVENGKRNVPDSLMN